MVLRSKGCRTCRQRRVKCDETHPECQRCRKLSLSCAGYDDVFFDEGPKAKARAHAKQLVVRREKPQGSRSPSPNIETIMKLAELPPSGYQETVFFAYLLQNLFAGSPRADEVKRWVTDGLPANGSPSMNPAAIKALATVYFGRKHHQDDLINQGAQHYSAALLNLSHDLQDPKSAYSQEVLDTSFILELYEIIVCTKRHSWLQHAGGIARLMEARGPWKHQKQPQLNIYEQHRMVIVVESLSARKKCFLEQEIWKTVPWALDPGSKSVTHYLIDSMCDLPGLLSDTISLESGKLLPSEALDLHADLCRRILAIFEDIYQWRWEWEHRFGQEVRNAFSNSVLNQYSDGNIVWPSIFQYPLLTRASEIINYNSALILLLRLRRANLGDSFDFSFDESNPSSPVESSDPSKIHLHLPGECGTPLAAAIEICRSVEYCLSQGESSAGAYFVMFPLRMAHLAIQPNSQYAPWLRKICAIAADISGFEIGRDLAVSTNGLANSTENEVAWMNEREPTRKQSRIHEEAPHGCHDFDIDGTVLNTAQDIFP
ncbi:hypothetical protein MMC09_003826 [Bachmanniomyces sp. S44760]|nr:hypothetical protein [Bachmanniomyces sp. S44760]